MLPRQVGGRPSVQFLRNRNPPTSSDLVVKFEKLSGLQIRFNPPPSLLLRSAIRKSSEEEEGTAVVPSERGLRRLQPATHSWPLEDRVQYSA